MNSVRHFLNITLAILKFHIFLDTMETQSTQHKRQKTNVTYDLEFEKPGHTTRYNRFCGL